MDCSYSPTETEFNTEVREAWGDMPINTKEDVAIGLLVACADSSLHGEFRFVSSLANSIHLVHIRVCLSKKWKLIGIRSRDLGS